MGVENIENIFVIEIILSFNIIIKILVVIIESFNNKIFL